METKIKIIFFLKSNSLHLICARHGSKQASLRTLAMQMSGEECSRQREEPLQSQYTASTMAACLPYASPAGLCGQNRESQQESKRRSGQRGDRHLPCFRTMKAIVRPCRLWISTLSEAGAISRLTFFLDLHGVCSLLLTSFNCQL